MNHKNVSEMNGDEMIEYLNSIVREEKNDFKENVTRLKKNAAIVKRKFLALGSIEIKDQPNYLNANYLMETYIHLMFFPDKEIYEKFENLGYKKNHLTWFLPIKELIAEFIKIEKQGDIFILRNKLFESIKLYYVCQVTIDATIWTGQYSENKGDYKKTHLVSDLEKIYRRKKYANGILKEGRNVKDNYLISCVNEFTSLETALKMEEKSLLKLLKGQKPRFFLSDMINCFISHQKKSDPDYFFSSLYNLFKLILRDALPSVEEIEDSGRYSGKSRQGWQAHLMRTLIFKNSSKLFVNF